MARDEVSKVHNSQRAVGDHLLASISLINDDWRLRIA
jgi:hypothetical protein